jgi:phospholipid/cholesterol/gamma-HCH transport system substrate-binding protein
LSLARIAALAAIATAVVVVAVVFFGGGGNSYELKLRFQHASQLVKGSPVEASGAPIGSVTGFDITDEGQAEVRVKIQDEHAPVPVGTRAVVRAGSQSSAHNRYVDLHYPPENGRDEMLADGATVGVDRTTTLVSFDQFFSIFDKKTRKSLRGFLKGNNRLYAGRGEQGHRGLRYLNPALAQTDKLFDELRADPPVLDRFLIDSERLVSSLAERRGDLSSLVGNLNRTTRALGSEKAALSELVGRLPPFLRTANTTYVNLRATLDDLEPFVQASKPVARKLGPYLDELRPFARDARPTVRDTSRIVRRRGDGNDLIELARTYPPLAEIAVETRERNGRQRRGSFPEATQAFRESAPIVAHGRPYTVDFVGWFDDFSQTGVYDALGSISRAQAYLNSFTVTDGGEILSTANPAEQFKALAKTNQFKRCPGASEEPAADGSNVYSPEQQRELDCVESHRATGPKQ